MDCHSEYLALLEERLSEIAEQSYEEKANYLWLRNAPSQYRVEASMLDYAKRNPNATSFELCAYFDKIAPDGLAPGDDGADLLEDN